MLSVTAADTGPLDQDADVLVVPCFKGGITGPGVAEVLDALGLADMPTTPSFRGDIGQTLRIAAPGQPFGSVLFVGLGRMDATSPARLREAAGIAVRAVSGSAERVATTLPEVHAIRPAFEAIAEGFALGSYTFDDYRTEAGPQPPSEAVLCVPSSLLGEARQAIARADITARAVALARDLVNTPPQDKRPPALAARLEQLAEGRVDVAVRDEAWLEREGFGGTLAVGRGSSVPPRLVELRHRPDDALGEVLLVGKGITFDSGGLSLKRGDAMEWMKADMAGVAACAAACLAAAELDVGVAVTALLGLAENLPGADAQRPSDVITCRGGTTVEVRNTDAEGRLVLADLLAYASELGGDHIVDVATLTGGQIIALGTTTAALMSDDDDLADALARAGRHAGEPLWRLPLLDAEDDRLESTVADVSNHPSRPTEAASITAALFLRRFVDHPSWAHLDIAGPSFAKAEVARGHRTPGGTGFPTGALLRWLAGD